ncbi:3-deoxy-manno-octulosonate cytidylyltransferase [Pedobacter yulinensis]|uniref:3-deoxy-manno-octulosonate cytidylyltransferase n=1 Tax=Pedobacter yulinensis TaxID=2126353 RepID=A0A2T3HLL7_9SPHI|nr:3-deoxy-manno-octulosonate cytidylyltransferase [Pedobacter yulinensis]PST83337.1 3-deoxy-manno-octulosonate cytidylyltransferase [Pedobacter yulinensis]
MSRILGVIPARYASSRFPGKPLADIGGKTMIRRVYEQASKCSELELVVVATDDQRIADEVKGFGGRFIMTAAEHQSGTDRCAEVLELLPGYDVLINIQGDEPFIDPAQITLVARCFAGKQVQLATLIKKITAAEELFNPNIPKVVCSQEQEAVYFSRHPIPYFRNDSTDNWLARHVYYKHLGIYGYRAAALRQIRELLPAPLEQAESLEQLRWLEHGMRIYTRETELETVAIDTPQDLEKVAHLI